MEKPVPEVEFESSREHLLVYLRETAPHSDAELRFVEDAGDVPPAEAPSLLIHSHRFYEIIFFPEVPQEVVSPPVRIHVIPPGVRHAPIERDGCVVLFQIAADAFDYCFWRRGFHGHSIHAHFAELGRLLQLLKLFQHYETDGDATFRRARRDVFLLALASCLEKAPGHFQGKPYYVNSALWYIEENFSRQDLRVTDVAAHAALSVHQLNEVMKSRCSLTIRQAIQKRRMDEAERLLRLRRHSIAEITALCGFRERNYFTNLFQRLHGLPPAAWREAAGREAPSPTETRGIG